MESSLINYKILGMLECKMGRRTLMEPGRGAGGGNPASFSLHRPSLGLPGMELLVAHLPEENPFFLTAHHLKGSICFKIWVTPTYTSKFCLAQASISCFFQLCKCFLPWSIFRHFSLFALYILTSLSAPFSHLLCYGSNFVAHKQNLLRNVLWSSPHRAAWDL